MKKRRNTLQARTKQISINSKLRKNPSEAQVTKTLIFLKNFEDSSQLSSSYSSCSESDSYTSETEQSFSGSESGEEIEIKVENFDDIKPKMSAVRFEKDVYTRLMGHQKKKEKKIAKMKIEVNFDFFNFVNNFAGKKI